MKDKPPATTHVEDVTEIIHGVAVRDPYRWLEDQNNSQTRDWIAAQDEYARSVLSSLPQRKHIRKRLEELLRVNTISPPCVRGNRYFFFKRSSNEEHPIVYMRNGSNGIDEALLNPNNINEGNIISGDILDISVDGNLLAYGIREGGEDEVRVIFLNVESREQHLESLPKDHYLGLSLKPDGSGFYYSRLTGEGPRVYYHNIGTDPAYDLEVFGKGYDVRYRIGTSLSTDGKFLMLSVKHGSSANRSEIFVQDIGEKAPVTSIINDVDASFAGAIEDGYLYLRTNWQAPNWRVLRIDLSNPSREHWREIVPEAGWPINEFSLVGGKVFVSYLEKVSSQIRIFDVSGNHVRDVALPSIGYANGMWGSWRSNEAFYFFNSFAEPPVIYQYQVSTGEQEVWDRITVPINRDKVEVRQVWYQSRDKTKVPMFLVYKKGLEADGNRRTLLSGYGGFGVSMLPSFSARAAFWV